MPRARIKTVVVETVCSSNYVKRYKAFNSHLRNQVRVKKTFFGAKKVGLERRVVIN